MKRSQRTTATLTVAALTGTLLLFGAAPAHAAELDVCPSGCTYATINDAVAAAQADDTIRVGAGTYAESVVVDKSLTILGPNANISPNSNDPHTANTARVAEAIINPPSAASGHAFRINLGAPNVTISGFAVNMSGTQAGQLYVHAEGIPDLDLTLSHNLFENARAASAGNILLDRPTADGDRTVEFQHNRVVQSAASNGLRISSNFGGAFDGETSVDISDNVWLNNRAWAMHLSSFNMSSTLTGTVQNNWIGNTTANTSGVSAFGTRQSGIYLHGSFDELVIDSNTIVNVEHAAFNVFNNFNGTVTISNNTVDGYSNFDSLIGAVLVIRPPGSSSDPTADVTGIVLTDNRFDNPEGSSRVIRNQDDTGVLDARLNWWGQSDGPLVGQIVEGEGVLFDPWLAEPFATGYGSEVIDPNATVTFRDRSNNPLLVGDPEIDVADATFTGSGESWIEARVLAPGDLPVGATPFSLGGAILLDLTLLHDAGTSSTGPYTVCIAGDLTHKLWHFESGAWVDITNRVLPGGTALVFPGKVCGMVNDFSPFALAGASDTGGGLAATGADFAPITWSAAGMLTLLGFALALLASRRRKQA